MPLPTLGRMAQGSVTCAPTALCQDCPHAQTPFALTLLAARCYGSGMGRAANHLPPNRKASEQERAYFKRLGELEEAVPKFGSRPPRQLGEVLEELARHRAQWPMHNASDDLAEHLAERKAMMRKSDAGSAGMAG